MYPQLVQQLIETEGLPPAYGEDAQHWLLPYIQDIGQELGVRVGKQKRDPLMLGINGAQGTGKTTLCKLIKSCLENDGYAVTILSIDDFYLSKTARSRLATEVHPLLATRGVPGTHDVGQLHSVLSSLGQGEFESPLLLPQFNKASDDVLPQALCPRIDHPVDLVVLEGWFIGVRPEADSALEKPINRLEAVEDKNGAWRRFVNERLALDYVPVFERLDKLLLLQAPSFEMVYEWRGLQEQKLRQSSAEAGVMNDEELQRFIQHYERLTRHGLATLPAHADEVFTLNEDHRITGRSGL